MLLSEFCIDKLSMKVVKSMEKLPLTSFFTFMKSMFAQFQAHHFE